MRFKNSFLRITEQKSHDSINTIKFIFFTNDSKIAHSLISIDTFAQNLKKTQMRFVRYRVFIIKQRINAVCRVLRKRAVL